MKKKWTREDILLAMKSLKENQQIDFSTLQDMTPEELAVFEARDTKSKLKEMLNKLGIFPDDSAFEDEFSPITDCPSTK